MAYRSLRLAAMLAAIWAVLAMALGLAIWSPTGGLYTARHEGDTLHLADIVMRQVGGAWPHLDYMSPLGLLSTWPIAVLVGAGWGMGRAILLSQILLGALLLPALWWVAWSRFKDFWGLALGGACLVLAMALVHGKDLTVLSISMHYNRWGWAIAFVPLTLAVLPPVRSAPWAEGVIIGLSVAILALMKVTYAVAVVPVVLAALAMRGERQVLSVAFGAGLSVVALLTLLAGPAYWVAYVGDLVGARESTVRSAPGESFLGVITEPAYLAGSLLAFAVVVLWRQAGRDQEGALLLLALPGFFFVTYQNFENDPQWLYLLGVLVLAVGMTLKGAHRSVSWVLGVAIFAVASPSFLNLATSPFRHLAVAKTTYSQLVPGREEMRDLMFRSARLQTVMARRPVDGVGEAAQTPALLNRVELPDCRLETGMAAMFEAMAARVVALGHGGRPMLEADLFNSLWLYNSEIPALAGGSPWHYGALPGVEAAEVLLVPTCPILPKVRRQMLAQLSEDGWSLNAIGGDDLFLLLELQRPK